MGIITRKTSIRGYNEILDSVSIRDVLFIEYNTVYGVRRKHIVVTDVSKNGFIAETRDFNVTHEFITDDTVMFDAEDDFNLIHGENILQIEHIPEQHITDGWFNWKVNLRPTCIGDSESVVFVEASSSRQATTFAERRCVGDLTAQTVDKVGHIIPSDSSTVKQSIESTDPFDS